jgi:hypothetical protein
MPADTLASKETEAVLLRIVVRCPENLDLHILTDIQVDERFLGTVADTFVSVLCPQCAVAHVKQLKFCRAYKLKRPPAEQAA